MKLPKLSLGVVLAVAVLTCAAAGAAGKPAVRTAAKPGSDIGAEKEIYGPMALRAVPKVARPTDRPVDQKQCYECHEEIRALKEGGRHASNNCVNCHDGTAEHLKDESRRPVTRLGEETCGGCHPDQYSSLNTLNLKKPARTEKSLLTERSPNPFWDKLMMGHGFTKEHANPRSHAFMLVDQFLVDRAFGGRFQPKAGWSYVSLPGPVRAWDVIEDRYPGNTEHKAFLPETAAAVNPTCMQCKTQDQILKWRYMGDKDERAKWDRTSNPVAMAKDVQNGMNCFICHDPHAARPRIVRDALIQALTRPEKDTLWHRDPKPTKIDVKDFREGYRKIALLEKYDANLQCGQCHVEYNCNPGFDSRTGEFSIKAPDRRTNHFPFKNVLSIYDHYEALGFRDFRHGLTGGLLWKAQHPEAETYWGSVHDRAGARCDACHMPKVRNAKGKVYTSHWATSPKNYLKQTCLTSKCHPNLTEHQAIYEIESIRNYTKGRMRKAEFWLSELIDRIVEAKAAGISADVIREAQEQHQKAHVLWEWWTAENSDGFHNPSLARESLTKSMEESKKGIRLIADAMAKKTASK
jgi:formate-dependent nitrite reductase cytochrome c552 subunit